MTNQKVTSRMIGFHFASAPGKERMGEIMRGIGGLARQEPPAGEFVDCMPLKAGPFLDGVEKRGIVLFRR
jgi:hypothetical protein